MVAVAAEPEADAAELAELLALNAAKMDCEPSPTTSSIEFAASCVILSVIKLV